MQIIANSTLPMCSIILEEPENQENVKASEQGQTMSILHFP